MNNKPSSLRLLTKGFHFGLQNVWRNKVLSIATIFVIGIIIFIFNVILTINLIAQDSLQNLSRKVDIVVYLKESTQFSDTQRLKENILQLEGVENVVYTSKEQALQDIKTTHPDLSLAFEKYDLGNPLPASLNITTIHPQFHQGVADFLNQDQYKKYLSDFIKNDSTNNAILTSVSENLFEVTNFTQQLIFWLIITFIVGGALIILNGLQITIFSRKNEINVMKLVGASPGFIRFPFIIESIVYGICAILLSFLLLFILTKNLIIKGFNFWDFYANMNFYIIFLIELGITVMLCIASSIIAVHEYLQKTDIE